jgi:hypothetical protein
MLSRSWNGFKWRNKTLWDISKRRQAGKCFSVLYTAIQQLPANIDKGIKMEKERERWTKKQRSKFLHSCLLPGIALNKALCFGLNKHNGKLN